MPHFTSRPAWLRLKLICDILRDRQPFNRRNLSELIGVTTKTIQRDINTLRRSGLEVTFNVYANCYSLRSSSESLAAIRAELFGRENPLTV